jgi:hypothetical protein
MGEGILQQFNINELAGATGLILGALGGLLAIIWKSRCHCKLNLCYLCQCERFPPPDNLEEDSSDEEPEKPKEEIIPKDKKNDKIENEIETDKP